MHVSIRRRIIPLCAAVLTAFALTACGQDSGTDPGTDSAEQSSAEETRAVATPMGEVTIPADPQRVVVLNYALAGYLYHLDVPIVGVTPEDADGAGIFSEFWADDAEAAGTEFLPWSVDGFDIESIAAMDPDLIIAGGVGFPYLQASEAYDDLSTVAPTVLVDRQFQTWQEQFGFLANDVFDQSDVLTQLTQEYEDRRAEVIESITPPPNPVSYVTITADGTPYVLIEDMGLPADLVDFGFEPAPVFANSGAEPYTEGGDMFEVSLETIGQVVTTPTVFVTGFNGPGPSVEELRENPIYAALPAFAAGHAYDMPYWAIRADYDEAIAFLDHLEEQFA
ncbi:iron complex transport system substrate-binding protein [Rhodococcus sp. SMB37]|nr:iron complex transport system substrate-binding protein [Rhodococcus sp. SMB37]